jgi:hypothetical protein
MMQGFVAWELEGEHGDLGLGSGVEEKPPLSLLGRKILDEDESEATALVMRITDQAENNIALARARLEIVHTCDSVATTRAVRDRLPPGVTALFDAIVSAVEGQPAAQRDLGLMAIAAVGHDDAETVEADALMEWLHKAAAWSGVSQLPHRSLEDVLEAAKGSLIIRVPLGEEERFVLAFHDDFHMYVQEGYRESLLQASGQLAQSRKAGLGKLKPSQTFQVGTFLRRIGTSEGQLSMEPLRRIMRRQTGRR